MPLTHDQIHSCALRLDQAEKSRSQIRQLSREFPDITIADAYAIQRAWIDIKVTAGRIIKGHKIGLTSKAMQSALNIDEPDSGVLLDDMFFADGGIVPSDRFIATRIEAELGEPAHRQRAVFAIGKILPHPDQRLARRHASGEPRDEAGRSARLMAGREHLVQCGRREPAAHDGCEAPPPTASA